MILMKGYTAHFFENDNEWTYSVTIKPPAVMGEDKTIYECPKKFECYDDASDHFTLRYWNAPKAIARPDVYSKVIAWENKHLTN